MIDCPYEPADGEPARISEGETAPAEMEKSGGAATLRGILKGLVNEPTVPVKLILYDPSAAVESAVTSITAGVDDSIVAELKPVVTPDGRLDATARVTFPVKPLNGFKLTVDMAIPPCGTTILAGSEPRLKSEGRPWESQRLLSTIPTASRSSKVAIGTFDWISKENSMKTPVCASNAYPLDVENEYGP